MINRLQKMTTLMAGLALVSQLCACGMPVAAPAMSGNSGMPASASPATAMTSNWTGVGPSFTSVLNQSMTSETEGSFTEVVTLTDGTVVNTVGTIKSDLAAGTSVYTYTQPKAAVVKVQTEEQDGGNTTVDTVTESNSDLFKVGDKITYTKK
ncbi:MAG: hypothetical protein ACO1RX_12135 [Candidatus Sericytochromatia bacterium]